MKPHHVSITKVERRMLSIKDHNGPIYDVCLGDESSISQINPGIY